MPLSIHDGDRVDNPTTFDFRWQFPGFAVHCMPWRKIIDWREFDVAFRKFTDEGRSSDYRPFGDSLRGRAWCVFLGGGAVDCPRSGSHRAEKSTPDDRPQVFRGAKLLTASGPAIENGVLIVQQGKILAFRRREKSKFPRTLSFVI